ncbi:zinc-binding alcohol dehydrogenase family protein [Mesorhizobium sp. RMAD-H1]|uniref:quinone oxidoreductase family protein n=1 Tax=Mesorhizobium sp. RMAD-H1 TaxID=2587065 RepID=UPI00160ED62E|nr:zinc-binding alcohol dehydrogenase family protein [Mesorhizobium sp. RMAD-H1]MBB2973027.1 NADPH:quinone reductase-like Zn-dependent oxidoreductase [Mesorhizobium sp. RMAD-H1]
MKAAVVTSFDAAPEFGDFDEPLAGEGETVVMVGAAPLSPIVRALAAGRHYAGARSAGFVAGVDGVGTDPDGRRVYFLFPKAPFGSMAERALVSSGMLVPVPEELADDQAAAIATAGLASWIALTRRAKLQNGETVLVTGANGAAGRMALQLARHLGASKTVAVARTPDRLEGLDADVKIALNDSADEALRAQFDAGIDIVLDFVWGEPASRILKAAASNRGSPRGEPRLRYVQLGTLAGDVIPLRGDMLRGSGLELLGSGIGSVPVKELLAGAGELLAASPAAGFAPPFQTLPLNKVAEAWSGNPKVRYIIQPNRI